MTRLLYIPDGFYWRFDSCNDMGWTIEFEESISYFNYCLNKDTYKTNLSVRDVLKTYIETKACTYYYSHITNKASLLTKEEFEIID